MWRSKAFTLVELLVAISISSILIVVSVSVYNLFRRSTIADQAKSDLSQNARVALDRLTRELRQTPDIVTQLPASPSDTTVVEPNEIEFEDGNVSVGDPDYLTYHRYYLAGTTLEMDIREYYFASDTSTRVHWNDRDASNNLPIAHVISTQAVAQDVSGFVLYGQKPVEVILTTSDPALPGQTYQLRTYLTGRNI